MTEPLQTYGSKLVLGTVQFGVDYGISNQKGQTNETEAKEILSLAARSGIQMIDTAYAYGTSEETIGRCLPVSSTFQIISKFPDPEGKRLGSYLTKSLERLRVSHLYGYLAHSADVLLKHPDSWRELIDLREEGVVSKIGYSLYTVTQLESLLMSGMIPDIVQVPYNIFDRRFEKFFQVLKKNQTEIHARSAFLQGLFFVDPATLPDFFDSIKILLAELRGLFSSTDELLGALLQFCVSNPQVDKVVIGVNNAQQLKENISSLGENFFEKNWDQFQVNDESILLPYHWPKK